MPNFRFSKRSKDNLNGVHPDLVKVAERALEITPIDFVITEGRRSPSRQEVLYKSGASSTLNSRHITGHAIDFAALLEGKVEWAWPLYEQIGKSFKQAAKDLGVRVVWGGDWKKLRDGPHIELDRSEYP